MGIQMLEDVLKSARIKLNLKQSEVAELLGITTQTYLKWENGRSEPKISQVGKLATVLGVTERELCQGKLEEKKIEPLEFVRRISVLMDHNPQTETILNIHRCIPNDDEFIKLMAKTSDYPYEMFNLEEREEDELQAKFMLKAIESNSFKASPEDIERAKKHAMKVLGMTEVIPDVRS